MPPASSTLMRQIIPFSEKIIFSSLYLAIVSITNNINILLFTYMIELFYLNIEIIHREILSYLRFFEMRIILTKHKTPIPKQIMPIIVLPALIFSICARFAA